MNQDCPETKEEGGAYTGREGGKRLATSRTLTSGLQISERVLDVAMNIFK